VCLNVERVLYIGHLWTDGPTLEIHCDNLSNGLTVSPALLKDSEFIVIKFEVVVLRHDESLHSP